MWRHLLHYPIIKISVFGHEQLIQLGQSDRQNALDYWIKITQESAYHEEIMRPLQGVRRSFNLILFWMIRADWALEDD